jgi:hypothetical protein
MLQLPLCLGHGGTGCTLLSLLLFKKHLQLLDGGFISRCNFLQLSACGSSIGIQL